MATVVQLLYVWIVVTTARQSRKMADHIVQCHSGSKTAFDYMLRVHLTIIKLTNKHWLSVGVSDRWGSRHWPQGV